MCRVRDVQYAGAWVSAPEGWAHRPIPKTVRPSCYEWTWVSVKLAPERSTDSFWPTMPVGRVLSNVKVRTTVKVVVPPATGVMVYGPDPVTVASPASFVTVIDGTNLPTRSEG